MINSYSEASPVPSPSHAYPCTCPLLYQPRTLAGSLDLSHFWQSEDVRDPLGNGCEPLVITVCSALWGWLLESPARLREQLCPLLGMMTSLQPDAPDFYLLLNIFPFVLVLKRQHGTGDYLSCLFDWFNPLYRKLRLNNVNWSALILSGNRRVQAVKERLKKIFLSYYQNEQLIFVVLSLLSPLIRFTDKHKFSRSNNGDELLKKAFKGIEEKSLDL